MVFANVFRFKFLKNITDALFTSITTSTTTTKSIKPTTQTSLNSTTCTPSHLITSTTRTAPNKMSTKKPLSKQSYQLLKATMPRFLRMVKLERGKPTQWRGSNTTAEMSKEESFLGQSKRSSIISRIVRVSRLHLWCELHTYRYTMKLSRIF